MCLLVSDSFRGRVAVCVCVCRRAGVRVSLPVRARVMGSQIRMRYGLILKPSVCQVFEIDPDEEAYWFCLWGLAIRIIT